MSSKRKKSLTPEPAGRKKQQTLLSAFARIDRALAEAKPPARPPIIDLTNRPSASGPQQPAASGQGSQQKSASQGGPAQPQKSVSHVSASFMELNQTKKTATSTYQQSVTHVSDSCKPRSVQGSVLMEAGSTAASAGEASSPQLCPEQVSRETGGGAPI